MKLTEDYKVSVSDRNVVLEHLVRPVERFKVVDGTKTSVGMSKGHWEVVGYYPSHQACLRAFVNMELRGVPQDAVALLRKIDELYELIGTLPLNYVFQCNCKRKTEEEQ